MAAVQRLLDERLPKEDTTKPTDEQLVEASKQEAADFLSQYPDARIHDTLLAQVLRDYPGVTLHSAYFQLKEAFAEKGFDWSRTLEENVKGSASSQSNNGEQGNQQQNNQNNGKAPLPGARAAGGDDDFKLNNQNLAHEDMDTSDIVRQAMRENGLNI
jgi:hypothetical protein